MNKRINIRWTLVIYDFVFFLFSVGVFLFAYHGGGVLRDTGIYVHCGLAFICLFGWRFAGKIYMQIWRFGGVENYLRLLIVDCMACLTYMVLNFFLPIKVIAMSRVMAIIFVNVVGSQGMRMIYRYAFKCGNPYTRGGRFLNLLLKIFAGQHIIDQRNRAEKKKAIAIIGAGRVGVSLAEELLGNSRSPYIPVCFIDINESKVGRHIHGLPVFSEQLINDEILTEFKVKGLVFAVPSMTEATKKMLGEKYGSWGFPMKIYDYPVMHEPGQKRQLRDFNVEDVLFRNPITVADDKTREYFSGKVILVTGGGGSIGSELSRQVARMNPARLILLDVYENGVYDVNQDIRMKFGRQTDVRIEIASITNRAAMEKVFAEYRPQIVIHAAAHKHVPLMEHNCIEAIENNVFGTLNVVELCEAYGVERFMMLSTDKAVNPTNVMGATKRMCEYIVFAHSSLGNVKYTATRFGNVLGSAGSVIPLFRKQIAEGGPVTLTDKRIIRYFMTIPEASQLVLQSGAMAKNGDLFVLDMGQPVKILDLAENIIRLSGLAPYEDIDIVEIGLRPGEKLYEETLVKSESLEKTDNNLIFIEHSTPISLDELKEKLEILRIACASGDNDQAREALRKVVPTFRKPEEVNHQANLKAGQNENRDLNLRMIRREIYQAATDL